MWRRAIALTYYFEAAGSQRPGGVMVSVFLCVLFVLFVVLCMKWQLVKNLETRVPWFVGFAPLVDGFETHEYIGFSIENKMADLNNF